MDESIVIDDPEREDNNNAIEDRSNTLPNNVQEVISKRKRTAPVWSCISEVQSEGGKGSCSSKCNFCNHIFLMTDGSTSNAVRHLTKKHFNEEKVKLMVAEMKQNEADAKKKREEAEKKKISQPALTSFISVKGVIDPKKQALIEKAIIKYLVKANRPWRDVENSSFRNILFTAEPNYVCPSSKTVRKKFDDMAEEVGNSIKKEVCTDVTEAGHFTCSIMTDHGTSSDLWRTKKNVVVLSRTTKHFQLVTDTIDLIPSVGSQTGLQIKKDVKNCLMEKVNLDPDLWVVNWVTDGASNCASARNPDNHLSVGMTIAYNGQCVDHIMDLVGNDTINEKVKLGNGYILKFPILCDAMQKMKKLVNYLGESSLARQAFNTLMVEHDMDPLRTVKGTSNRFFTKFFEAERFVELKEAVTLFFENYDRMPDYCIQLDDDEWHFLEVYKDALKLVVKASEILEGRDYPTASSVIPFLDTIAEELTSLASKVEGEQKKLVESFLLNMKKEHRFGWDLYKYQAPYNILTLLDVRYGSLFFDEKQKKQALSDLAIDRVYNNEKEKSTGNHDSSISASQSQPLEAEPIYLNALDKRRKLLMAQKNQPFEANDQSSLNEETLLVRLEKEVDNLSKCTMNVSTTLNPMDWYKLNHQDFPLLTKFWLPYSSFPATSCNAERVFNVDTVIITDHR